jgi:hypothetical protein
MSDNPNTHGQARPRFDPTINCGEVLTVSSFLIAAASLLRYVFRIAERGPSRGED